MITLELPVGEAEALVEILEGFADWEDLVEKLREQIRFEKCEGKGN